MAYQPLGLQSLPIELLYEIQLFALSESLPLVSRHFYDVFKHASSFFNAHYILGRSWCSHYIDFRAHLYTKALLYPICDLKVLQALGPMIKEFPISYARVKLAKRIFHSMQPPESGWSEGDHPLPLLRYLFDNPEIPPIYIDGHGGYPLTRAVHVRFIPLINFLLDHGASPKCRDNLAVIVAIRQKDLEMVKLLVERKPRERKKGKKRKTEDRVELTSMMLKAAVQAKAQDIVEYLYRDKGVLPDVATLKKMSW